MDLSKEYIQMCDCPEIQDNWELKAGDCFKIIKGKYYIGEPCEGGSEYFEGDICYADEQSLSYDFSNNIFLWLPRQDQLQEMLGETHSVRPISLVGFLHQVLNEDLTCTEEVPCNGCVEEAKYWRSFGSMEKLWLAFVMKEKFNKAWDGKWL